MRWQVSWRGQRIGIAELGVRKEEGALRVESRFRTTGLAERMNPVEYRLVTPLQPEQSVDNLHSALGRLRTWAGPQAGPGRLFVKHGNRTFQVDFASPLLDASLKKNALRIDGEARAGDLLVEMTIWLSADSDRSPLRITVVREGRQVSATLLESGSES
jgi:hypothetical protein